MNKARTVAFHTLGCKLNFSETSTIARMFENENFTKVDFADKADVYVINTCSVTENANRECRSIVRKALRVSPDACIAVIGCYAQLKPDEIASIPGVDLVLGASEKFKILEFLNTSEKEFKTKVFADEIKHCNSFVPSFSSGDRTRSFLKVQDGCDYFCAFCTIPLARGFSRSDTVSNTVTQAEKAVESGAKEIVITGVNTGDFGKNSAVKGETFYNLLTQLEQVAGLERIRISSIEPNLLTDEIIELVAKSEIIAPHFHIPLQSGSDKILSLMRRRYDTALYRSRIEKIKSLIPDCCIGADVIVGFPSESEADFLETYTFLNSLNVSYLHVFTYSERDNTTAIRMTEVVPIEERNKRNKMLQILSEKKKNLFYSEQSGKDAIVLFEAEQHANLMHGFTSNYVKVQAPYNAEYINKLSRVKLSGEYLNGEMRCQIINYSAVSI